MLFIFACYNTVAFLLRQKRYQIYSLVAFYVLTFVIILARVCNYSAVHRHWKENPDELGQFYVGSVTYFIANQAKTILGFY